MRIREYSGVFPNIREFTLIVAVSMLVGCGGQSRPDPVASHVLVDTAAPLECPEPEMRQPPLALTADVLVATPTPLPAGQGDYGVTRAGWEMLIDGMRALQVRLALWKAWAGE